VRTALGHNGQCKRILKSSARIPNTRPHTQWIVLRWMAWTRELGSLDLSLDLSLDMIRPRQWKSRRSNELATSSLWLWEREREVKRGTVRNAEPFNLFLPLQRGALIDDCGTRCCQLPLMWHKLPLTVPPHSTFVFQLKSTIYAA